MGILVIGAVFMDIKGYPLEQYIPGGRNVGRVIQVHGGVSRNVVEDIANVELRPTYLSVVDHSGISDDVINKLRKHKVNTDYIARTDDGLGTWLAVFDQTGDVVASISKRPELEAVADVLDEKGDEIVSACDSIVVEIDMERHILKKVFDLAEKYGKEVFAVVSNMSLAMERRDLLTKSGCFVCNEQEAGMLFSVDCMDYSPEEMRDLLAEKVRVAQIPRMIVTMGGLGAVYASLNGESGIVPPQRVDVKDTTGAGDAFFAGVSIGLTYGKGLGESCVIGTRLASAVIASTENVIPRFRPEEFGIDMPVTD